MLSITPALARAIAVAIMVAIFAGLLVSSAPEPADAQEDAVPIVFVHGFVGSGAQYQSQAMRFASNGYPAEYVRSFDYNSLDSGPEVVRPALDLYISNVLDELGAEQVYVLAHSLGTSVMQGYLSSSDERAARVAKYVNLDGAPADAPPGTVETLAIWGRGNSDREVAGAENVYFPDQTHTQVVTSPESFATQYEFLLGEAPATTDVLPEDDVEIAGRAVIFPENAGIEGATLEIWEVDGASGRRTGSTPVATYDLDATGAFGPLAVDGSRHYEFLILRPDPDALQHHIYMQPFTRSNYLIRLLSVETDSVIAENIEGSERHTTVTVIRYKEWWGDDPGAENDTLEISGANVINAATSPIANQTIGIHFMDRGSDGLSDLSEPDDFFFGLPFQSGVDIFMAAEPPEGAICLANAPRGDADNMQVVNVPNLRSSEHRISVEFVDFVRDGDPACGDGDPACGDAAIDEVEPQPTSTPELQLPSTGNAGDDGRTSRSGIVIAVISALGLAVVAIAGARLLARSLPR